MKKLFVLVFVSLFVPVLVFAGEKTVHSKWHSYHDTFVVNGVVYEVVLDQNDFSKILFRADGYSNIISVGSCRSNNNFRYCYDEYDFDRPETTITSQGVLVPGIKVSIYESEDDVSVAKPDVQVSVKVVQSASFGEEYYYNVTLSNKGDTIAQNVRFQVTIPGNISVLDRKDFFRSGSTYYHNTWLSAGQEKNISFKYSPVGFGEQELSYVLRFDGEEKRGSQKINVPQPYKFSSSLSPGKVDIFQSSDLRVVLENLEDEDLRIKSFEIRVPVNIDVITRSGLRRERAGVFTPTSLSVAGSQEYSLRLTPRYSGVSNINGRLVFEVHGREFEKNFSHSLEAVSPGVNLDFSLDKSTVRPGGPVTLRVLVENSHSSLSFSDLRVAVDGGFFSEEESVERLSPGQRRRLIEKTYIAPEEEGDYNISVSLSYRTDAGQPVSVREVKSLKVSASDEFITFRRIVTPQKASPGEEVILEVFVRNQLEEHLQRVLVEDELSEGVSVVVGQTSFSGSIQSKAEQRAFLYKILIPEDYAYDRVRIRSLAGIPSLEYETYEYFEIEVEGVETPLPEIPLDPDEESGVDEEENGVPPEAGVPTEPVEEERGPGFLSRIFRSIGDFISGFF